MTFFVLFLDAEEEVMVWLKARAECSMGSRDLVFTQWVV